MEAPVRVPRDVRAAVGAMPASRIEHCASAFPVRRPCSARTAGVAVAKPESPSHGRGVVTLRPACAKPAALQGGDSRLRGARVLRISR